MLGLASNNEGPCNEQTSLELEVVETSLQASLDIRRDIIRSTKHAIEIETSATMT